MKDSNELFELCKQVYQATGWRDTLGYIQPFGQNVHFPNWFDETITKDHDIAPLYTSDYLLEKLPNVQNSNEISYFLQVEKQSSDLYIAGYIDVDGFGLSKCVRSADTPLKALLKLTLKLHEEKQL